MTWITVDVSTDEFDDQALIKALVKRGYVVRDADEVDEGVTRIYEALYLGKQEEAMQRTREYVCNVLGRVL
jgi:DNA-binding MarR family transcriptional regulator